MSSLSNDDARGLQPVAAWSKTGSCGTASNLVVYEKISKHCRANHGVRCPKGIETFSASTNFMKWDNRLSSVSVIVKPEGDFMKVTSYWLLFVRAELSDYKVFL